MKLLFPGTSHPTLAKSISKEYGFELGKCIIKKFSCNETYIKLEKRVRGIPCYILQTITLNVNDDLMEIFLLADALRRHDASEVNLIIPHFGYARQDRRAVMGEAISAKLIADLLVSSGITRIIAFDLHSDQIEGFFSAPVDNLHCYELFAEYLKGKELKDPIVATTDAGAAKIASRLAAILAVPLAIMHKTRSADNVKHNTVSHTHLIGDVKDKTVILFDDMIDTAGSIVSAKKEVIKQGARKEVYVAATHAIFSGPAYERLKQADFKEIVVTDTIPLKRNLPNIKILSVAKLLRKVLR